MYLSRLQLNTTNRAVWREVIGNPYKAHQMIMRGFPVDVNREEAGVLHRLDVQDEAATLLVQSALEPDWSAIDHRYLAPTTPADFLPNPAVKPLQLPLQPGQILSFRLCANPTVKKVRRDEAGERRNSNRVPLVREEEQLEWLHQRAVASGFRLLRVTVSQAQQQQAWKKNGDRPMTLYMVQFDGQLQVQQPEAVMKAVAGGIGPAKAFGCGLLSLARA